jgi:uncharacterized membrane protein YidH (DUF202 family)
MKNCKFILSIITLLGILTFFAGCYSYYTISSGDFLNKRAENKIKVILKDKKEVFIENPKKIIISDYDEIGYLRSDSTTAKISFNDVNKIMEQRFDFGKTFFSTFWISTAALLAALIIYVIIYGPLKFG